MEFLGHLSVGWHHNKQRSVIIINCCFCRGALQYQDKGSALLWIRRTAKPNALFCVSWLLLPFFSKLFFNGSLTDAVLLQLWTSAYFSSIFACKGSTGNTHKQCHLSLTTKILPKTLWDCYEMVGYFFLRHTQKGEKVLEKERVHAGPENNYSIQLALNSGQEKKVPSPPLI